jgi:hypothetical protein
MNAGFSAIEASGRMAIYFFSMVAAMPFALGERVSAAAAREEIAD